MAEQVGTVAIRALSRSTLHGGVGNDALSATLFG